MGKLVYQSQIREATDRVLETAIGDMEIELDRRRRQREREITERDEVVAHSPAGGGGSYVWELVNCGKSGCKLCGGGSYKHGPYLYLYLASGGKKKHYIGRKGRPAERVAETAREIERDPAELTEALAQEPENPYTAKTEEVSA